MTKTLTIHNDVEQLPLVASFLNDVCEQMGWGSNVALNLQLVMEEAVANVVMYAYPEGEVRDVWITAECNDDVLTLVVEDEGMPFDPTEVPEADVTLSAEERQIGGLGIFLVRQLMDEVKYERREGRNVLMMKKKIQ